MADYEAMSTMVRIGAYRAGSDAETDRAVKLRPQIEAFLGQGLVERWDSEASFASLARILGEEATEG
jgi:flagellum-specific ATP synthase